MTETTRTYEAVTKPGTVSLPSDVRPGDTFNIANDTPVAIAVQPPNLQTQPTRRAGDREQRLEDALQMIIEGAPMEPAVATGNENNYQIEDIGAHNRHLYLANIARKALEVEDGFVVTETTTDKIPDFGMIQTEWRGTLLESKAIAPGLSMQDLINVFCTARATAEPGDELAGNPSKWPDARGVKAVADAMLKAIYHGHKHRSGLETCTSYAD